MADVYLAVDFPDRPIIERLSGEAAWVYVRSLMMMDESSGWLGYLAEWLTEKYTLRKSVRIADELVEAGLWLDIGGEYYVAHLEMPPPGKWVYINLGESYMGGNGPAARVLNPTHPKRQPIPPEIRADVMVRDQMICGLCGEIVPNDDVHIDHIMPVSRGGTNEIDNLQVAHSECNIRKGDRI